MASYEEKFKSKLNWPNVIERKNDTPLDRTSMFSSYEDAVKYAQGDGSDSRELGGTSYVGQIICVYENDNVDVYKINSDRSISEIGSAGIFNDGENW